jgi:hypothetical protein
MQFVVYGPSITHKIIILPKPPSNSDKTRGSVDWACVAHLSFCFEET